MKIAHLSDLHLLKSDAEEREARRLVSHILTAHEPAEVAVAISGDAGEHGKREEFELFLDVVSPLKRAGFTLFVGPGNHDYGKNGIKYERESHDLYNALVVGGLLDRRALYPMRYDMAGVKVIVLDSTAHKTDGELFARGRIGKDQLSALAVELQDHRPTVIILHHHPWWRNAFLSVVDADQFLAVVGRHPHLTILFGHRHKAEVFLERDDVAQGIASGKSTDPEGGKLSYRLVDPVALSHEIIRLDAAA